MGLESGTYIDDLNAANPAATDGLSQADDHMRLLKSTIKNSFPQVSGAVTSSHTELNALDGYTGTVDDLIYAKDLRATGVTTTEFDYLDGVTSSIQTQLNTKATTGSVDAATVLVNNLTATGGLSSSTSYAIPFLSNAADPTSGTSSLQSALRVHDAENLRYEPVTGTLSSYVIEGRGSVSAPEMTIETALKHSGDTGTNLYMSNVGNNGQIELKVNVGGTSTTRVNINSSGVSVTGAFSKSSGSFKIDHPLDAKKDTHHLVHSFIEGPQADNIYRGTVALVDGAATVNLDTVSGMTEGTFVALNGNVQCFTSNETNFCAVRGSVSGNVLSIVSKDDTCTATVSWMVVGERHDPHMIATDWTDSDGKVIVEPAKE